MVREYHEANIALRAGADDNVIRGNAVTGPSDHNGIALEGAHANTVEDNTADGNGGPSNGCGIDIFAGASNNMIRNNVLFANARAGVRVRDAGAGNVIVGNVLTDGGANGVINQRTSGTHIEGNRALHHVGIGERTGADAGAGIRVLESDGAVVIGNEPFESAAADLLWDEHGRSASAPIAASPPLHRACVR
jgi:parallel beta-helix repeat protein